MKSHNDRISNFGQALRMGWLAHALLAAGRVKDARRVYRRTDKREQAQEHLTTAIAMYRGMDMTYWLERAEAEMTNLGIELAASRRPAI